MELNGKKVYFLGDSITEGVGSHPEKRYTEVFAKSTGADVVNLGVSGTRIARSNIENDPHGEYFKLRAEKIKDDADVIVIFGGTNDFGNGWAPIGNFEDRTPDTYYGAWHDLLTFIISNHPTATVLVLTPMHRYNEDSLGGVGSQKDNAKFETYVNIVREVAQYYSVPVLDMYRESGIQPAIPEIKQLYIPDGLHPNNAGSAKIARMIENKLKLM